MWLKILIGIAVIILIFVVVVALRPSAFRYVRSINIAAPPQTVFAQVNDFHRWTGWSPWEKMDPDLKRTYEGPSSGVGSVYKWVGNNKVGEGIMTIERSDAPSNIGIKLVFIKPFAATNAANFTFTPAGGGTDVTWSMEGQYNFMAKAMGLFMDFDKMVGADFEKGLASMKSLCESSANAVN